MKAVLEPGDRYDVAVIGGGPAGSVAATVCARAGLSVVLLEKRPEVGVPNRCAEGIPREDLSEYVEPRVSWVASPVHGGFVESPGGFRAGRTFENAGYILERKVFDRDLFALAGEAGAETFPRTEALELVNNGGAATTVTVRLSSGGVKSVGARVFIGADGVESAIGKSSGLSTSIPPRETHSCAQYLMAGVDLEPESCLHFYVGQKVAPGGYAWAFPKGGNKYNVGLGVCPDLTGGKKTFDYLDEFVGARFPRARPVEAHMGLVPASGSLKAFTKGNVALIGDAARHTDPFSGAGLVYAMYSGKMAAEAVVSAFTDGADVSESLSEFYQKKWEKSVGKIISRSHKIRKMFLNITDRELDALVNNLDRVVQREEIGVRDIIPTLIKALVTTPGLILKARHLL